MEMWSEIRREVLTGALSKRAAIAKYGSGWHTLKKMLAYHEPPGYRQAKHRPKPKLEPFLPVIRQILEDYGKAPTKQKHTARRIFECLRNEYGYTGTTPDTATIRDTAIKAEQAGADNEIEASIADKGYHSTKVYTLATDIGIRTYISEHASPRQRRWIDKDPKGKRAVYLARRRTKSVRGKQLGRLRSEITERSFAHVCGTGGARRTWLRGLTSVAKRQLMMAAARNLSTIMRAIIGIGGQGLRKLLQTNWTHFDRLISALERLIKTLTGYGPNRSTAVGG